MEDIITKLEDLTREARKAGAADQKRILELELQVAKLTRGNETLQEVIRTKDDLIIPAIKDMVKFVNSGGRDKDGKKEKDQ